MYENGGNYVQKTKVVTSAYCSQTRGVGEVSYANILNGCVPKKVLKDKMDANTPTIILDLDGPILSEFPLALVGSVKDLQTITNIRCLCKSEGFNGVDVKYIGGLWVMMKFGSISARDKFIAHEGVKSWFKELKPWTKDFKVMERLIWLDVEGVPIKAWSFKSFTMIVRKWGEVIFKDDDDGNNLYSSRICIKSSHPSLIFETVKVILEGNVHYVRVKEVCGWIPDFIEVDSVSEEENWEESAHVEVNPTDGVGSYENEDFSEKIPDTFGNEESAHHDNVEEINKYEGEEERDTDDPFGFLPLLEKEPLQKNGLENVGESVTHVYPLDILLYQMVLRKLIRKIGVTKTS
ncbi:hypothetical protein L6452_00863 [Arctium lappa]|uniref:Uncharacterized protein n=1 Tax=Arctium lappa TaxID=4217 RepID=A0ACB9FFX3_ARCLA|nr:hypothetical protein L6452_00863 [Arctium lappa]